MPEPDPKIQLLAPGRDDVPDAFVRIVGPSAPTLVVLHGISRNAAQMASYFAAHDAFAGVNIVAPLFDKARFGQYQQLTVRTEGQAFADRALFRLLNRMTVDLGIATDRILLFGFSGGAQMAHRLAMLYPSRISALCAVAAGWYLMPDQALAYPYGLKGAVGDPDHAARFAEVPITVIVGALDNRVDAAVRQDDVIVELQGRTRLRRARVWTRAMANHARAQGREPQIALVVLDNGTHDFGQCAVEAGLLATTAKALLTKRGAHHR